MTFAILLGALALGTIGCLAFLLRKIAMPKVNLPVTTSWIEELSVGRYRPMMRLLDEADFQFLAAQPGMTRQEIRRLRRERLQIFRDYLRDLNTDFACVCLAIKLVLLQSKIDRPDLALALVRNQIVFAGRMLAVRAQLLGSAVGLPRVQTEALLRLFDGMQVELRTLAVDSAVWGT
jgi:hypothetical protein